MSEIEFILALNQPSKCSKVVSLLKKKYNKSK